MLPTYFSKIEFFSVVMNKLFNKRNVVLCTTLSAPSIEEFPLEKYKELRGLYIEDPWERVKSLFTRDDQGIRHPELDNAIKKAEVGLIVGVMYGGTLESILKTEEYMHTSDTHIFQNMKEANKAFSNYKMLAFIKGSSKWAFPFAFFFGGFSLLASCCEAYRNKTSIMDSTIAGGLVGGVCRSFLGIKGFISGGLVGAGLGTIYGISVWIGTKATNTDAIELKYTQYAFSKYREQYKAKMGHQTNDFEEAVEKSHVQHVYNPLNQFANDESDEKKKVV